jgi:hypothetical protein
VCCYVSKSIFITRTHRDTEKKRRRHEENKAGIKITKGNYRKKYEKWKKKLERIKEKGKRKLKIKYKSIIFAIIT